jgi:hypothetical protein
MEPNVTITIKDYGETIAINVKGTESYKEILGLLEHAKMQIMCRYNKDYFSEGVSEDDIFLD